jgi:hypothetical protein
LSICSFHIRGFSCRGVVGVVRVAAAGIKVTVAQTQSFKCFNGQKKITGFQDLNFGMCFIDRL